MTTQRWAAVVAIALTAVAAAPARAGEGSAFQEWLHRRSPEDPFRYYDFFEAARKYFHAHVLGHGPDRADFTSVTRVVDISEQRDALLGEIKTLEAKIARAPHEVAERDRHIAEMRREKEAIEQRIAEARRGLDAASSGVGKGTIVENSRQWDERERFDHTIGKLQRRLDQVNEEITRTEMGRIKFMQTGPIVDELAEKRAAFRSVESGEQVLGTDQIYLVSHKPLMLLTGGAFLSLVLISLVLGRQRYSATVGTTFAVVMAGVLYVFLRVIDAEKAVPSAGFVASPLAFAVGFVALVMARGVSAHFRRHVHRIWPLKMALIVVALVQLAPAIRYGIVGPSFLIDAILPVVFFAVWGLAAVAVLESGLNPILQALAMAGVTFATVMTGALSSSLGHGATLTAFGVAAVLGIGLVATAEAHGRKSAAPRPETASAPQHAESGIY